ncbi:hypothetical protein ACEWY4_026313 [Coilia grayii]|uniref:ribonuclease H n=1 Tax=Coilia grayii TaxID=363190 RepID=A0ABD1IUI5_9TELE
MVESRGGTSMPTQNQGRVRQDDRVRENRTLPVTGCLGKEMESQALAGSTKEEIGEAIKTKTRWSNGQLVGDFDGETWVIDTGAEISVRPHHYPGITPHAVGTAKVALADGSQRQLEVWQDRRGMLYFLGTEFLLGIKDIWRIYRIKTVDDTNKEIKRHVTLAPEEARERLESILSKGLYATSKNDSGFLISKPYKIPATMPPIDRRQFIHKPAEIEGIAGIIKDLLEQGVIRRVNNPPCLLPLLAVPKPDGSIRMVHDLRELNRRTIKDATQLINPQKALALLQIGKYLSTLDLKNGFWSIPLEEESQEKTCFQHNGAAYCWTRLPQGFVNAPNVFQQAMEEILEGLNVVVYIDDILISTDTIEEHLDILNEVIERITKAQLKIGLEKCSFLTNKCKYLGFQLESGARKVAEGYMDKITQPKRILDLEKMVGRLEYISSFIPHFAEIVGPLHKLKRGLRKKEIGSRQIKTFDRDLTQDESKMVRGAITQIKKGFMAELTPRIITEPLIVSPLTTEEGATILLCNQSGGLCALKSMIFSPTEKKFTEREQTLTIILRFLNFIKLLAAGAQIWIRTNDLALKEAKKNTQVVSSAQSSRWGKWQIMMEDEQIAVWMDGDRPPPLTPKEKQIREVPPLDDLPIVYYTDGTNQNTSSPRHARWGWIQYNADKHTRHRKGEILASVQGAELQAVAEALADADNRGLRNIGIVTDSEYVFLGATTDVEIWKTNGWKTMKGKDLEHKDQWKLLSQLSMTVKPHLYHIRSHQNKEENYSRHNARNDEVDRMIKARLLAVYIPPDLETPEKVEHWYKYLHEEYGHIGLEALRQLLKPYKITVQHKVYKKIKMQCEQCVTMGKGAHLQVHPELKIGKGEPSWEAISIDVGQPVKGVKGHTNFLIAVCNNTGKAKIYPVKSLTGPQIVRALESIVPMETKTMRSDNAPNLKGRDVQEWTLIRGIRLETSIPYKSFTNGVAERAVRKAKDAINGGPKNRWDSPPEITKINLLLQKGNLREKTQGKPIKEEIIDLPVMVKTKQGVIAGHALKRQGNLITVRKENDEIEVYHPTDVFPTK